MTIGQHEKASRFLRLHEGPGAFIIPNPWDTGSARILAGLGLQALATSSAASAAALGRKDHELTREESLAHARLVVNATDPACLADLGKGLGERPVDVAETVRLAADAGLVGCAIEDATGASNAPLYDFHVAVERIAAGAEAARALPFPFLLTARAHNQLFHPNSIEETISRRQAFEKAGAGVLFAPGPLGSRRPPRRLLGYLEAGARCIGRIEYISCPQQTSHTGRHRHPARPGFHQLNLVGRHPAARIQRRKRNVQPLQTPAE